MCTYIILYVYIYMQYPIVKNPMVWDDRTTWRKLIAVARD